MPKFTKKPIEIEAYKCSDILYSATNNWENYLNVFQMPMKMEIFFLALIKFTLKL